MTISVCSHTVNLNLPDGDYCAMTDDGREKVSRKSIRTCVRVTVDIVHTVGTVAQLACAS